MWLSHHSYFYSWIKWELEEINLSHTMIDAGFPGGSYGKESACSEGDLVSIPGLGRSPGGVYDNALQYSCLENPHGQRCLVGCSLWGSQRVRHDWATKHPCRYILISAMFQNIWNLKLWIISWRLKSFAFVYYFAEAKHGHVLKFHSTEELIRKVSNYFPYLSLLWSCPKGKLIIILFFLLLLAFCIKVGRSTFYISSPGWILESSKIKVWNIFLIDH